MPEQSPDIRERDVEAVATWLLDAARRLFPNRDIGTWKKLTEARRDGYRAVARALLESPPLALRRRVRELEGK